MLHVPGGVFFHGEVDSSDAHLGIAATLYDANGGTITLGATQRVILYDVAIFSVAGGRVVLTDNTDVAGARIIGGSLSANGTIITRFSRPVELVVGKVPTLFAAAGQVDATINGEIVEI